MLLSTLDADNGVPVTAGAKLYAAKMTPDEEIVLHMCQKSPFQAAEAYAEVCAEEE